VVAWIPHRSDFKPEDCRRAASDFNRWGEKLKAAGLVFGYHPHGYEFRAHGDGTLLDLLIAETRPELVTFEMDVFWVVHGGGDPVQLMKKYPRRFAMMHLKDMKKGTAVGIPTGNAPDDTNVVIGTGQIDFKAILREAVRIGMKHYFIEDESVEAINQLPLSLDYLRRLRL
jgi:sugar phosphate isomerase/epimerase